MSRRSRARLAAPGVAALAVAAALAVPSAPGTAAPAPPAAVSALAEGPDCGATGDDADRKVTGVNEASEALQVPAATALAARADREPGDGVRVVVADTEIPGGVAVRPRGDVVSAHGLTAAGIVGGEAQTGPSVAVGIAPAAVIVPAPFYDAPRGEEGDGEDPPSSEALARVLRQISVGRRTIVLVPAVVSESEALRAALDRLHREGALVIAPVGDVPGEGSGFLEEYATVRPGQDAAADVWPAAHPEVLAVGISSPAWQARALRNSAVDLAAPGAGSVSVGVQGGWCVVAEGSTEWAAAQVAGVAALVWSVHRDDTADELRGRLQATASGNGEASPLTGFGVVQPVEALQRPVESMGTTGRRDETVQRGKVPAERADLLADTRREAVWWGLGGGGALVVLLVLRPVLARRRRS